MVSGCTAGKLKPFTKTQDRLEVLEKRGDIPCHKNELVIARKLYKEADRLRRIGDNKGAEENRLAAIRIMEKVEQTDCKTVDAARAAAKKIADQEIMVQFKQPVIATEEISQQEVIKDATIPTLETIYFPFNTFNITDEAKEILLKHSEVIQKGNWLLTISGHTDRRGSEEYNLMLSEKRGKEIKHFLVTQGIDGKLISVVGYGEEQLNNEGDQEADHALNRRGEFQLNPLPKGKTEGK